MPPRFEHDDEFRRFAVSFAPTLLRAGYMLLRNIDLAEDAVQTTMLRSFHNWDRARGAPEAYTRRVLLNVCRDYWRAQARRPIEVHDDERLMGVGVPSFTTDVDRRAALAQALADLHDTQREVLVLRYFLDLSLEETAAILNISEGTVKSATHRGLARLRTLLAPPSEAEAC